jgi:hypothetical protein
MALTLYTPCIRMRMHGVYILALRQYNALNGQILWRQRRIRFSCLSASW